MTEVCKDAASSRRASWPAQCTMRLAKRNALIEAGASEAKARAAAEVIPVSTELATKTEVAVLKTDIAEGKVTAVGNGKAGIPIAGLAVLLNRFLEWAVHFTPMHAYTRE